MDITPWVDQAAREWAREQVVVDTEEHAMTGQTALSSYNGGES